MRYSPSMQTCYPEQIKYPSLPDDLITFDDALFNEWCNTPGAQLAALKGKVVIVPPPAPVEE